jgi:L-ascorbate metabolism protein UlaG (beta-lactamase superfamily)
MRIKWYAHAAFLLEGNGLRIVTDPYVPEVMNLASITEPADLVLRSSGDDQGHCNAAMIPGTPAVITATEITTATVRGLTVTGIPAQESLVHKESPLDNAMYCFTLDGIRFAHMGDAGNRLTDEQLVGLSGTEVLLALTGGPPTLELDDLCDAIEVLKPRVVIPMHYQIPGLKGSFLPVTAFTDRFPPQSVRWIDGAQVELTRASLPQTMQIIVLKPTTTLPQ